MDRVSQNEESGSVENVERRSLVGALGARAAGVAALGMVAAAGLSVSSTPASAQGITDVDIFNFALNLEYLEAEYYLRGVTGTGLVAGDVTGTGAAGGVTGGSLVPFRSSYLAQYMAKIAIDEQAHVKFIRAVLGAGAVARPAIDFTTAFTTLARAAGLITSTQTFNPFADEVSFLLGAFVFEDVGVTAYGGAASLITNRDLLSYAASVLAVEAYHAGAVRTLIANIGGGAAANAIANLRDTLSGPGTDEVGVIIPGNNFNFAPTDSQAQTFRRTPRQVLNIVYGGSGPNGLFFPAGMNGTIVA